MILINLCQDGNRPLDNKKTIEISNQRVKEWIKQVSINNKANTSGMDFIDYLLNDTEWNKKFLGDNSSYVIGAPTWDMYAESYKVTHPYNFVEYEIVRDSNNYQNGTYKLNKVPEITNDYGNIYTYGDASKPIAIAGYMYKEHGSDGFMIANENEITDRWSGNIGLRPIVCLNSDVELEKVIKNGQVTYKIAGTQDETTSLRVYEKDTTNGVVGVKIRLEDENSNKIELTTDSNGEIDFSKNTAIKEGNYICKIISCPQGYVISKNPYKITINEDKTISDESKKGILYIEKININSELINNIKYITEITTENSEVKTIIKNSNLINANVKITDINGKELKDTDNVGTGTKIEILDNDNNLVDSYTVAIKGDINGDGKIDLYDIQNLIEIVFDKGKDYKWSDLEKLAGECTGDKEGNPDIYDVMRLIEYHFDKKTW